jgi:hypothetical protein
MTVPTVTRSIVSAKPPLLKGKQMDHDRPNRRSHTTAILLALTAGVILYLGSITPTYPQARDLEVRPKPRPVCVGPVCFELTLATGGY